jgi:AcrR family transcriptional regulator
MRGVGALNLDQMVNRVGRGDYIDGEVIGEPVHRPGAARTAIARRAGVSKQTVYNHYGSKAELIRALVDRRVVSITASLREPGAEEHPQDALRVYARTVLKVVNGGNYGLMRVTIQSAGEMPDLARAVFEAGPVRSRAQLAAFLEMETRAGRMNVADPAKYPSIAAWQQKVEARPAFQRMLTKARPDGRVSPPPSLTLP